MTTSSPEKKRKIVTRWEWFFIIILFIIFLSVILSKFGIHVIQRTEDSEIIHHTR